MVGTPIDVGTVLAGTAIGTTVGPRPGGSPYPAINPGVRISRIGSYGGVLST